MAEGSRVTGRDGNDPFLGDVCSPSRFSLAEAFYWTTIAAVVAAVGPWRALPHSLWPAVILLMLVPISTVFAVRAYGPGCGLATAFTSSGAVVFVLMLWSLAGNPGGTPLSSGELLCLVLLVSSCGALGVGLCVWVLVILAVALLKRLMK